MTKNIKHKVTNFVKTHKKELTAGAVVIGGVVIFAITKGKNNSVKLTDLPIPETSVGTIKKLFTNDKAVFVTVTDLTTDNFGEFVTELASKVNEIEPGCYAEGILAFDKK